MQQKQGEADETMLRLVAEQIVTPASLVLSEVNQATKRDFAIVEGKIDEPNVMHRKVGHRDLYAVYHVDKGAKCYFRSLGGAELWNPWTSGIVESLDGRSSTVICLSNRRRRFVYPYAIRED